MLNIFSIAAFCLLLIPSMGEAVKCYHCFESFTKSLTAQSSLSSFNGEDSTEKFVRCDKNINKWNSWDCPAKWPVCILMSGTVQDHYEIVRTCGQNDFCSKYVPPQGVKLDYCRECNTTLCNDYLRVPDPPVEPGSFFTFNININLNINKYTMVVNKTANTKLFRNNS